MPTVRLFAALREIAGSSEVQAEVTNLTIMFLFPVVVRDESRCSTVSEAILLFVQS